ncbi:MAG: HNH endonuclease [bacterium]
MTSYERKVFKELALPTKETVIPVLLTSLLKHNGSIKEFGAGKQDFSDEIAERLGLSERQRSFLMQALVRKENRIKTFPAWHRLLFRTADLAAKCRLLSHPKETVILTQKREWMLTEKGLDEALRLSQIPLERKIELPVRTHEVQKVKNKLEQAKRVENYNPIDTRKRIVKTARESLIRTRGFRQAILEAYDYCCSFCGMKIISPDKLLWEVEAAYIVPHRFYGKDDIWNGIAFCHFHHWAFDVGWFTLRSNYSIQGSEKIKELPIGYGIMDNHDLMRGFFLSNRTIRLPKRSASYPHINSICWHRENIFHK